MGKHGFHNVLERAKLGQFLLKRLTKREELENLSAAERIRLAFEELGPTFVKFGQLLSTRPNLIPQEFVEEFKKFHDQVAPLPYSDLKSVIEKGLGRPIASVFSKIEEQPLAAGSIAQVHEGVLVTGERVVLKIQRPGIQAVIKQDINVLYTLVSLVERYVPESKPYSPRAIVDEFFKTLELELDFLVEANNIHRITENFLNDEQIKIPKIYNQYSSSQLLVQEKIPGVPLSDLKAVNALGLDHEKIVIQGLTAFYKMVFKHGLFHGDLHSGNIFILPDGKIGLVDFGVVGRLSKHVRRAVAIMLYSMTKEDYETMANEYVDLSPYNPALDIDQFVREIRDCIAPYHGMTFKNVNFGKLLMDSTSVAARNGVVIPSELMLLFKAIVTVEGMGRTLLDDFDVLETANEFVSDIIASSIDPKQVLIDLMRFGKDTSSLILTLPRHLKQLLRRVNSKDFALDIRLKEIDELNHTIHKQGVLQYYGLVIAAILIASSMALDLSRGPMIYEFSIFPLLGFAAAGFLSLLVFANHLRR